MTRDELKDIIKIKLSETPKVYNFDCIFDVHNSLDFYFTYTRELLHDPFFKIEDEIVNDVHQLLTKYDVKDYNINLEIDSKIRKSPYIKIELILK